MRITLEYGLNTVTREFADNSTVADVRADTTVQVRLQLPENVKTLVDGMSVDKFHILSEGDTVTFEKQAAEKAAAKKKAKKKSCKK